MASRIFVSSTCHDLLDVRAELETEIRNLGLHPVMSDRPTSEFEVAPERDSITSCLTNVETSDFVLVLFNQRYGPSLKDRGFPDVSATQLEAQYAREKGRNILFFARDRFLSDHAMHKAGAGAACKWVKGQHDQRQFAFFDEMATLKGGGANNWFDTFTTSIDLRAIVRQRLGKISRRAQVEELISTNRLPTLLCWLDQDRLPGITNGLASDVPFRLTAKHGDLYDLSIGTSQSCSVEQGFLAQDHVQGFKMNVHDNTETPLLARYTTVEGHIIEDLWHIVFRHYRKVVSLKGRTVTPGSGGKIKIIDQP